MLEETLEEAPGHLDLLTLLPFNEQTGGDIVQEQVNVVGGYNLFYRLNHSLKDMKVEPLFIIKEQWKLYSWRQRFFEKHFPDHYWGGFSDWIVKLESLGFLLCCKFDQVASLASKYSSSTAVVDDRKQEEFNEVCIDTLSRSEKIFSLTVLHRFDKNCVECDLLSLYNQEEMDEVINKVVGKFFLDGYPFSFDDLAAMVGEFYPSSQIKSLEDIAMKAVLKHGVSMEEVSSALKKKSVIMLQGKATFEDEAAETGKDSEDGCPCQGGVDASDNICYNRIAVQSWKKIVGGKGLTILGKIAFAVGDFKSD